MPANDCEAIVLVVRDYGEADKIVTIFTREHGKMGSIARYAKKSRKRFGGALEIFARLQIRVVLKETISRLESVDVLTIFPRIREDLAKIGYAGYACELVDRLIPEAQPNTRLYRLLASYLEYLNTAPAVEDDRRFFEANMLNILGYRIPLEKCVRCGTPLASIADARFQSQSQGIFCGSCSRNGRKISPETLLLLTMAMRTGQFGKIRFPGSTLPEAGEILDASIDAHLSRPLNSLSFLQETVRTDEY